VADQITLSGDGTLSPRDREYWTDPEMVDSRGRPLYGVSDVAKHFFGKSTVWLRMRLFNGYGARDDLGPLEPSRSDAGHRKWHLHDVERLARALLMENAINMDSFGRTINAVKAAAYLYGFDIGDYDPMATEDDLDPVRAKAVKAVVNRLEQQDTSFPSTDSATEAEDHLVERTAWSMRALEDYYRGATE
jgi:hypothetical protein